ncbi:hypothetical protein HYC85_014696 [Camellia sinensis]|uniref:Uncharacterized protein n=1 Tax=Camellia sinensis TaxID=4442 RepID=A0A7J7H785_CAMSI|nr:hypothetical protein HYC85_014696 [Camellia sinensis]
MIGFEAACYMIGPEDACYIIWPEANCYLIRLEAACYMIRPEAACYLIGPEAACYMIMWMLNWANNFSSRVRKMLGATNNQPSQKLNFIDAIQRLACPTILKVRLRQLYDTYMKPIMITTMTKPTMTFILLLSCFGCLDNKDIPFLR